MLFTDSPPAPPSERRQTRVSYEQNGFPGFGAVTNKEISQIIKQAVPEIHDDSLKTRLLIFALYMIVKLIELNLFLLI